MRFDPNVLEGISALIQCIVAVAALAIAVVTGKRFADYFKGREVIIAERDGATQRAVSAEARARNWNDAFEAQNERLDALERSNKLQSERLTALAKFTGDVLAYTERLEEIATTAGLRITHLGRPVVPSILAEILSGGYAE